MAAPGRVRLSVELERAREFALSLPEVTEAPHFEWGSWRVRGKSFATIPTGGTLLHIFLDPHDGELLAKNLPEAFEELHWGEKLVGVRVNLPAAEEDLVASLLEMAWRRRAPKRLVAEFDRSTSRRAEQDETGG